jgi:hypothetical protein
MEQAMIILRYVINGAKYQRRYDATTQRRAAWIKAVVLLQNGVTDIQISERSAR